MQGGTVVGGWALGRSGCGGRQMRCIISSVKRCHMKQRTCDISR